MFKKIAVLLSIAACSAGAQAAGGYVLGAVGGSHINTDCANLTTCDNTSTGLKLVGGFQIHDNLALELGYMDLGKSKSTYGHLTDDIGGTALFAAGALQVPLGGSVTGIGRLGLASVESKETTNFGFSKSERTAQVLLGVGLSFAAAPKLGIEVAWDHTNVEIGGSKGSVNMISLGASLKF